MKSFDSLMLPKNKLDTFLWGIQTETYIYTKKIKKKCIECIMIIAQMNEVPIFFFFYADGIVILSVQYVKSFIDLVELSS